MTAAVIPGPGGERVAALGDRAVICDLYDEVGSRVYHELASSDTTEVRELLRLVRPLPGGILELAAGSGRLTFPLLALGREVVALELSASMLDLLRAQLDAAPQRHRQRCTVVHGDMSRFALGRQFGAIVLGSSSVSLLDASGRQGLFRCVREHLAPGGRFLLTTVEIDPSQPDADHQMEVQTGTGLRMRIYEHWAPGSGARTVVILPVEVGDGPVRVCTSTIRVLPPGQLRDELAAAGLQVRRTVPVSSGQQRHVDVLLDVAVAG